MAELWYYTTEGKQMDPVSMKELKRLVGDGILKPTDMVWKDGMPRWVRASSMKELFPDPGSTLDQFFTHSTDQGKGEGKANQVTMPMSPAPKPAAAEPAPSKKAPQAAPVEEEPRPRRRKSSSGADDEEDTRDVPRRRRPETAKGGSNFAIIIAVVIGALLLIGGLGVGVVILILVTKPDDKAAPPGKINPANVIRGETKYDIALAVNARDGRKFSFRKNVDYEFIVKTRQQGPDVDVDLHIFNANGGDETKDIRPDADCYLRWRPRQDGEYRVDVVNVDNFGRAVPVNCSIVIREFKNAPIVEKDGPVKEQPLPADTMEGKGLKEFTLTQLRKEGIQKFRVKGGHKATFTFVPLGAAAKADFNLIVIKDSDPNQVIARDEGPAGRASVAFTLPATEIVRVRIVFATGKGVGRGQLLFDASP